MVKCVAHSLDLMLEDIGKLSFFSETIEAQKRIVRFITIITTAWGYSGNLHTSSC